MITYIEWPGKKCPFPYFTENQMKDLGDCIGPLSPGDVYGDKMESFLKRVSPGKKIRDHLGEYFSNNDINKPEKALEILRGKVSDDDGYTLCSLHYSFGNHKHMTIGRLLQLIDDRIEMKISVYNQAGILCVTKLEAPLIGLALQQSPKKPEKVSYPVLPSGTPAVSLNYEIALELEISEGQMKEILNGDRNLGKMIRVHGSSIGQRVVETRCVEDFKAAVQRTERYQRYMRKRQPEQTHTYQEKPSEEEIILGALPESRRTATRGKTAKRV